MLRPTSTSHFSMGHARSPPRRRMHRRGTAEDEGKTADCANQFPPQLASTCPMPIHCLVAASDLQFANPTRPPVGDVVSAYADCVHVTRTLVLPTYVRSIPPLRL
jgi:hypothetical protein